MACIERNGVICKIKQAFSEVNSRIILFFLLIRLPLSGLLFKILIFLRTLSCMHYHDINLLHFLQIEFELSAK